MCTIISICICMLPRTLTAGDLILILLMAIRSDNQMTRGAVYDVFLHCAIRLVARWAWDDDFVSLTLIHLSVSQCVLA